MYYELYLDVFFLTNFMMDYILLLLLKRILKCTATHRRIGFAAALGAFLTCIVVIIPIPCVFLKFILFHMVVNTCMIRAGLKIKSKAEMLKALILLYVSGFLLGGVMTAVQSHMRIGSLFFALAIGGYYISSIIWDFISHIQRATHFKCNVELFWGEKMLSVKGIIDTGNGLMDPNSGEPVHVLDKRAVMCFLNERIEGNVHYVPYHSIGKKDGMLLVIRMDRMKVYGEKEWWIEKPMIGISEEIVSAEGEYKMILNPNSF